MFTNFGGFPKSVLIIKLFYMKEYVDILYINEYFTNVDVHIGYSFYEKLVGQPNFI